MFQAFPLLARPSLHHRLRPGSLHAFSLYPFRASPLYRSMSTTPRISQSHEERIAEERRGDAIHEVVLSKISQVNRTIRLLQLRIPNGGRIKARLLPFISDPFLPMLYMLYTVIKDCSNSCQLTSHPNSTVSRRPMARRAHSLLVSSRGLYHNLHTP